MAMAVRVAAAVRVHQRLALLLRLGVSALRVVSRRLPDARLGIPLERLRAALERRGRWVSRALAQLVEQPLDALGVRRAGRGNPLS